MATRNAATPVTSTAGAASTVAAAASASASAAVRNPAVASAATLAASSSVAAPASSAAAAAASSAAASSAAASSAAASSTIASSAAASSSIAASSAVAASSSSSASASASSSARSTTALTAQVINATSSASSSSKKGISGGAIGGIVAGAVIALIAMVILWFCVRKQRRTRGEKVPPPPPMKYSEPPSLAAQHRQSSMMSMTQKSHHRTPSTYSAYMVPPRPASTLGSHSRSPSSHLNYPMMVAGTMSHNGSPPMPPSSAASSESPSLSTGTNTPAHPIASAGAAPGIKPPLAPIETALRRDQSSSSEDLRGAPRPRHVNSVDRLRGEAMAGSGSAPGSERAPSPASSRHPSEFGMDQSRNSSPHASMSGFPGMPRTPNGYPRPMSMASLGSQRYLHVGPVGRAPHQGRPMQLTMPSLLGARPDENGDFFGQAGRYEGGSQLGLDEMGRMRRSSSRPLGEPEYATSPARTREPSQQSLYTSSRQGSEVGSGPDPSASNPVPPSRRHQHLAMSPADERVADPRTVLSRV
ncbi:hypothetical protein IAU60_000468 [Kwoniella sp. DSM 27419]